MNAQAWTGMPNGAGLRTLLGAPNNVFFPHLPAFDHVCRHVAVGSSQQLQPSFPQYAGGGA